MKRIIVCCDGTWNAKNWIETNVHRLFELIEHQGDQNIILQYYNGVGASTLNIFSNFVDGVYARTLEQNIKDAYDFIREHYEDGDEILCFGFSRGAYTVRCVAEMIHVCGLVPDKQWTNEAYRRYRDQLRENKNDAETLNFRNRLGCKKVKIKFLGIWDTVGSAGIPIQVQDGLEYLQFYDNVISETVENVAHAVSIHEHMSLFEPCLARANDITKTRITEVWFPGEHLDVGGAKILGYHDIAILTLKWMVDQVNSCTHLGILPNNVNGYQFRIVTSIINEMHPLFDIALRWVYSPIVRDRRIRDYEIKAIYNGGYWNELDRRELKRRFKSQTYEEYGQYMRYIKSIRLPGF